MVEKSHLLGYWFNCGIGILVMIVELLKLDLLLGETVSLHKDMLTDTFMMVMVVQDHHCNIMVTPT